MTGEQIHSPLSLNNRAQPIMAAAQIDRLAGSQPSRKLKRTEPNCASTEAADTSATIRTGQHTWCPHLLPRVPRLVQVVLERGERYPVFFGRFPVRHPPPSRLRRQSPPTTQHLALPSLATITDPRHPAKASIPERLRTAATVHGRPIPVRAMVIGTGRVPTDEPFASAARPHIRLSPRAIRVRLWLIARPRAIRPPRIAVFRVTDAGDIIVHAVGTSVDCALHAALIGKLAHRRRAVCPGQFWVSGGRPHLDHPRHPIYT